MRTLRLNSVDGSDGALTTLVKELKQADLLHPTYKAKKFDFVVSTAVKIFQSINIDDRGRPLTVDGVVGPLTWKALLAKDQEDVFDSMCSKTPTDLETSDINPIAKNALDVAFEEMEAGAGEVGGNNQGPFVAKYHRVTEDILKVKKWSWCAAFVSFCFRNGAALIDRDMPFNYTGGAQNILKQFQKKGWGYKLGETEPQAGDIIVWKRGSQAWMGHIGIVYKYKDGILYTIEGNRGRYPSKVNIYSYTLSSMESLLGFGRIPKDF